MKHYIFRSFKIRMKDSFGGSDTAGAEEWANDLLQKGYVLTHFEAAHGAVSGRLTTRAVYLVMEYDPDQAAAKTARHEDRLPAENRNVYNT